MRLFIIALLFAISYAQTVVSLPPNVQDGITSLVGVCDLVESISGTCSALAENDCVISYCRETDDACFTQGKEYGTRCETQATDDNGLVRTVQGVCVDSICVFTIDTVDCENPALSAERSFLSCGNAGFDKTWRFPAGVNCVQTGSSCQDFGPAVNNVDCTTSQTKDDPAHEIFKVYYMDHQNNCIIGEDADCVIQSPGVYNYMGMEITWSGAEETDVEMTTSLQIPLTTKILRPELHCPSGFCRGTLICSMWGPEPCGRIVATCDQTLSPTESPTPVPTLSPTEEEIPSSHGDPIIWTFDGDCYDLKKDGFYLASSHDFFDHEVHVGVYNDYMREIQIRNKFTSKIMFAVTNLGEVFVDGWPHFWSEKQRVCEPGKSEECIFFFKEFIFDAQELEYIVQVLGHDYLDPALKEGESGIHLDIYPRPFPNFSRIGYTGLYFENPIPFESGICYE